jgi:hypothetical protein
MATQTIYIELLGEEVDVWRPIEAEAQTEDIYRLPPTAPADEVWRFAPGTRVRCEWRDLSDGAALVAVEPATD